uniref:hypothetical protein n=1 Tax=Aggregatibacter actinomycetemcomitans TaxID=714 RepID=UPI001CA383AD
LPSALRPFTSEFGMVSGGTTALSPPIFFDDYPLSFPRFRFLIPLFASLVLSLLTSFPARYTRPLQKQASNQLPSLNSLS